MVDEIETLEKQDDFNNNKRKQTRAGVVNIPQTLQSNDNKIIKIPKLTKKAVPKRKNMVIPEKATTIHIAHENFDLVNLFYMIDCCKIVFLQVAFIMFGIKRAVDSTFDAPQLFGASMNLKPSDFRSKCQFDIFPSSSATSFSQVKKCIFKDYAPSAFQRIRQFFQIQKDDYIGSLGPHQIMMSIIGGDYSSLKQLCSSGKSGSFFYYTSDGRFMLKTISNSQFHSFKRILPNYYRHVISNPNTLISKIYGMHKITFIRRNKYKQKKIYFVIMNNVFNTERQIHQRYDLKGSTVGRTVKLQVYLDNPTIALKDLNFNKKIGAINVGEHRQALLQQIRADSQFFEENQILDYSMLLGIHFKKKKDSLSLPAAAADQFSFLKNHQKQQEFEVKPQALRQRFSFFEQDDGGLMCGQIILYLGIIDIFTTFKQVSKKICKLIQLAGRRKVSTFSSDCSLVLVLVVYHPKDIRKDFITTLRAYFKNEVVATYDKIYNKQDQSNEYVLFIIQSLLKDMKLKRKQERKLKRQQKKQRKDNFYKQNQIKVKEQNIKQVREKQSSEKFSKKKKYEAQAIVDYKQDLQNDQELTQIQKKLKVLNNSKSKHKLQKKIASQGMEDDLFGFLDNVEKLVRAKNFDARKYKPSKIIQQQPSIQLQDIEILDKKRKPKLYCDQNQESQSDQDLDDQQEQIDQQDQLDDETQQNQSGDENESDEAEEQFQQGESDKQDEQLDEYEQSNEQSQKSYKQSRGDIFLKSASSEQSKSLRDQQDSSQKQQQELEQSQQKQDAQLGLLMKRQLRGLMNRISDGNIDSIFSEILKLIKGKKISSQILKQIKDSFINQSIKYHKTPINLLLDVNCALLTALYKIKQGHDMLLLIRQIIQIINQQIKQSIQEDSQTIEDHLIITRNATLALINFYGFNCFDQKLLAELAIYCTKELLIQNEVSIQVVSLVISNIGHSIRKSYPQIIKQISSSVLIHSNYIKSQQKEQNQNQGANKQRYQQKLEFLNEDLQDLKNNKWKKNYNPLKRLDQLKYWFRKNQYLKSEITSTILIQLTNLTIEDFIIESKFNKLIGNSQSPSNKNDQDNQKQLLASISSSKNNSKLLDLASKLHMNTPIRRAVFIALMTSEDTLDAFQKVTRLKIKKTDEKEIVKVIVSSCISQSSFNPYYLIILQKFLQMHYSYKYSFQYTLWDHLRDIKNYDLRKLNNLAKLTGKLIGDGFIPIAVLRGINLVIEEGKFIMNKYQDTFMKIVLVTLFSCFIQLLNDNNASNKNNQKIEIDKSKLKQLRKIIQNLMTNKGVSIEFKQSFKLYLAIKFYQSNFEKILMKDQRIQREKKIKKFVRIVVKIMDDIES